MIDKLIFEGPVNPLSMGNVSVNLLKSLHKKGIKVLYLPIGNTDYNIYNLSEDFKKWLTDANNNFFKTYKRDWVTIKNWHLNGLQSSLSEKRFGLTYHETDSATEEEINVIKNTDKIFFCGNYSEKIFADCGAKNIGSFNLGFDPDSFFKTNKKYHDDGRISWLLAGKMETRKRSMQILSLWAKKFGKKQGESYKSGEQIHFLNLAVTNPFLDANLQQNAINQALGGQRYVNIQSFGFLDRASYNDLYNVSDIDLTGLSSAESWNLPAFNMTCLGKWSIVLNATGHKSWANEKNSILVNPSGKSALADGVFFHPNSIFSRGNSYTWADTDVEEAMDKAVKLAKTVNTEGEKLKETFTYDKTIDYVLSEIEKL